jgi:hypothetical protein
MEELHIYNKKLHKNSTHYKYDYHNILYLQCKAKSGHVLLIVYIYYIDIYIMQKGKILPNSYRKKICAVPQKE